MAYLQARSGRTIDDRRLVATAAKQGGSRRRFVALRAPPRVTRSQLVRIVFLLASAGVVIRGPALLTAAHMILRGLVGGTA